MYQTDNGVAAGGGGEPVVTLIENSGDEKELTKSVKGEGEREKEGGGEGETEDSPNQTEIEGSVNKEGMLTIILVHLIYQYKCVSI